MTTKGSVALILAPHCDDAEFGLGIAIQSMLKAGVHVVVVIAACGHYQDRAGKYVMEDTRKAESLAAFRMLGVTQLHHDGVFQENQARETPYPIIVQWVEQQIAKHEADDVYVCLPSFNQDHQVLYDATITALRHGGPNLYAYTYPGNSWGPPPPTHGRRYITASWEEMKVKLAALQCHRSQFEDEGMSSTGITPAGALTLAMQHGNEVKHEYAELIYVLREIV